MKISILIRTFLKISISIREFKILYQLGFGISNTPTDRSQINLFWMEYRNRFTIWIFLTSSIRVIKARTKNSCSLQFLNLKCQRHAKMLPFRLMLSLIWIYAYHALEHYCRNLSCFTIFVILTKNTNLHYILHFRINVCALLLFMANRVWLAAEGCIAYSCSCIPKLSNLKYYCTDMIFS